MSRTTLARKIAFETPTDRAERQGTEPVGRSYELSFLASDASGNELEPTVTLRVAHDQAAHDCTKLAPKLFVEFDDPLCVPTPAAPSGTSEDRDVFSEVAVTADDDSQSGCSIGSAAGSRNDNGPIWLVLMALLGWLRLRDPDTTCRGRGPLAARLVKDMLILKLASRASAQWAGCLLIAALSIGCDDGQQEQTPLGGLVLNGSFSHMSSKARHLETDRLAIDLADYSLECGNTRSGAEDGSILVTILISPPTEGIRKITNSSILDTSVVVSVTRWKVEGGTLVPEPAVLLTEGAITVDHIGDAIVGGSADVRTSTGNVNLAGSFSAAVCNAH